MFRERKARRISVALRVRGRRQAGAATWGRRSEEPKLKESIPLEKGEGIHMEQRAAGQGQAAPRGSQSRCWKRCSGQGDLSGSRVTPVGPWREGVVTDREGKAKHV